MLFASRDVLKSNRFCNMSNGKKDQVKLRYQLCLKTLKLTRKMIILLHEQILTWSPLHNQMFIVTQIVLFGIHIQKCPRQYKRKWNNHIMPEVHSNGDHNYISALCIFDLGRLSTKTKVAFCMILSACEENFLQ